jgi:hypothetical protein
MPFNLGLHATLLHSIFRLNVFGLAWVLFPMPEGIDQWACNFAL